MNSFNTEKLVNCIFSEKTRCVTFTTSNSFREYLNAWNDMFPFVFEGFLNLLNLCIYLLEKWVVRSVANVFKQLWKLSFHSPTQYSCYAWDFSSGKKRVVFRIFHLAIYWKKTCYSGIIVIAKESINVKTVPNF